MSGLIVSLALRDSDGAIVGGLCGATMWFWLMIGGLWLADALRGQRFRPSLATGRRGARRRPRLPRPWLGTFGVQARAFDERHGYAVFAELPGSPPGPHALHLWKVLVRAAG